MVWRTFTGTRGVGRGNLLSKDRRIRAWSWNQGESFIRFSPNPGVRFGKIHWSRHGGWRNRKREAK